MTNAGIGTDADSGWLFKRKMSWMMRGMILAFVHHNRQGKKETQMAIIKKLKELFDDAKVSYEVYNHPLAYTAQEIAAGQHFSGDQMAKVVILKVDGKLVMAVVTGSQKVHLPTVCASLAVNEAKLATEDEFISRFPDCEIGAIPPFGNLFGVPVYVDPAIAKDNLIYFNAGNHVQTVRILYKDFEKLANPEVVRLTEEKKKYAA
jgi:Ala-tRNA(Pro) deacylase